MSLLYRAKEQSFTTALQLQGLPVYPSKVHLNTTAISNSTLEYTLLEKATINWHQTMHSESCLTVNKRCSAISSCKQLHLWKWPSFHVILSATMTHYHFHHRSVSDFPFLYKWDLVQASMRGLVKPFCLSSDHQLLPTLLWAQFSSKKQIC